MVSRILWIALVLLALSGCSEKLALTVPRNAPVRVVNPSAAVLLQPGDPAFRQLQDWLAQNQGGWSQVYATNPNGGVLVSGGDLHLQFVGSAVFATTRRGMFTKSVKVSDYYAFLASAAGT